MRNIISYTNQKVRLNLAKTSFVDHLLKYQHVLSKYSLPSSRIRPVPLSARLVRYQNTSYIDHYLDNCLLSSFYHAYILFYLQVKTALVVNTCDFILLATIPKAGYLLFLYFILFSL